MAKPEVRVTIEAKGLPKTVLEGTLVLCAVSKGVDPALTEGDPFADVSSIVRGDCEHADLLIAGGALMQRIQEALTGSFDDDRDVYEVLQEIRGDVRANEAADHKTRIRKSRN